MMDKQKQIEEMAKEIAKRDCHLYEKCPKEPKHNCISQEPEIMLESSKNYITIATWLINAGYRKLPEDSVVLSREELSKRDYEFRQVGYDECLRDNPKKDKYIKKLERKIDLLNAKLDQAHKEPAEKIFERL